MDSFATTGNSSRILDNQEREQLRDIFRDEFNSELPDEKQANIIAIEENGEVTAFLVVELLLSASMIWSKNQHNGHLRQLIQYVRDNAPTGSSVVCFAPEQRDGLLTALGMRKIDGNIYRKDF